MSVSQNDGGPKQSIGRGQKMCQLIIQPLTVSRGRGAEVSKS